MIPTLITHPSYRPKASNPRYVYLTEDLVYEDNDYIIRLYAGYDGSDGGSLPRFSWTIIGITPTDGRCIYAFLIHDFLFQSHLLSCLESNEVLSRVLAIHPSCNHIQQYMINDHVFLYGWIPYYLKSQRVITKTRKFGEVHRKNKLLGTIIK